MMEEIKDIFHGGGDAIVYLAGLMHKKYKTFPQHLSGATHLVRKCLITNFGSEKQFKVKKLIS